MRADGDVLVHGESEDLVVGILEQHSDLLTNERAAVFVQLHAADGDAATLQRKDSVQVQQ